MGNFLSPVVFFYHLYTMRRGKTSSVCHCSLYEVHWMLWLQCQLCVVISVDISELSKLVQMFTSEVGDQLILTWNRTGADNGGHKRGWRISLFCRLKITLYTIFIFNLVLQMSVLSIHSFVCPSKQAKRLKRRCG